jgi:hypothetical protein
VPEACAVVTERFSAERRAKAAGPRHFARRGVGFYGQQSTKMPDPVCGKLATEEPGATIRRAKFSPQILEDRLWNRCGKTLPIR